MASGQRIYKRADELAPGAPAESEQNKKVRDSRRAILCSGCKQPVTHEQLAIEVADRHRHTCVNPGGQVYRIRCFRRAAGCVGHGESTDYFTWFAGFSWQVALCERCAIHLGWLFTSSIGGFCGLIEDRIRSADE